ncbi:hypothetical protein C8035_v003570 [Colletotrichum spinosum]|uniref:Uncharacterized protein n=1 Tax=Colletotrichum spinosum TaxID=1347390 RepID=A0A4R8QVE2_9PEZI|nr:hypothetical protein C8035_v003570 [Colletotrichum spinosum]
MPCQHEVISASTLRDLHLDSRLELTPPFAAVLFRIVSTYQHPSGGSFPAANQQSLSITKRATFASVRGPAGWALAASGSVRPPRRRNLEPVYPPGREKARLPQERYADSTRPTQEEGALHCTTAGRDWRRPTATIPSLT